MAFEVQPVDDPEPFGVAHSQLAVRDDHDQVIEVLQAGADEVIVDFHHIGQFIRVEVAAAVKSNGSLPVFPDERGLVADDIGKSGVFAYGGADEIKAVKEYLVQAEVALRYTFDSVIAFGQDLIALVHLAEDVFQAGQFFIIEDELLDAVIDGLRFALLRQQASQAGRQQNGHHYLFHHFQDLPSRLVLAIVCRKAFSFAPGLVAAFVD